MKRIFNLHLKYSIKNKVKLSSLLLLTMYFILAIFVFSIMENSDIQVQSKNYYKYVTKYSLQVKDYEAILENGPDEELERSKNLFLNASKAADKLSSIYQYKTSGEHAQAKMKFLEARVDLFNAKLDTELNLELVQQEILQAKSRVDNNQLLEMSMYTITSSNMLSKLLSGYSLIALLILILLCNYGVFSSDFENGVFKQLYSNEINRTKVFTGKLLFSITSTLTLLFVGAGLGKLILILLSKTGSFNELVIVNQNIFSFINNTYGLRLITSFERNIITLINTILLVIMFLSLVHLFSIVTKSASTTLSILFVLILSVILLNGLEIYNYLTYTNSLFNYQYNNILLKEVSVGVLYNYLSSIVYAFVFTLVSVYLLNKQDMVGD